MKKFQYLFLLFAFILSSSAFSANFSGVYQLVNKSCIENPKGEKTGRIHFLLIRDNKVEGDESFVLDSQGKLKIDHNDKNLKIEFLDTMYPDDNEKNNYTVYNSNFAFLKLSFFSNKKDSFSASTWDASNPVAFFRSHIMVKNKKLNEDEGIEIESYVKFSTMMGPSFETTTTCFFKKID